MSILTATLSTLGVIAGTCGLFACGSSSSPEENAGGAATLVCPDADGSAAELADAEALASLSDWRSTPVLRDTVYRQASSTELVDSETSVSLLKNQNRDMNNFICASDDAQYAGGIVPLTFQRERCEDDYVKGVVMAREEGSGYLGRLWLTRALSLGGEILRIYVDDEREPLVEFGVDAIQDGSAGEMFAAPFGAESGSHVAWYYPVVFSKRLIITADVLTVNELFYFQTDVVLDAEERTRTRACSRLGQRDLALDTLKATAAGPLADASSVAVVALFDDQNVVLEAGEARDVVNVAGPATIDSVLVTVAEGDIADLDELWLTIRWDDKTPTAAVNLPLSELFAASLDAPTHGSLALGATTRNAGQLTFRFSLPMPFSTQARWSLENRGDTSANFGIALRGSQSVPDEPWGYLHAQRHETLAPAEGLHPLLHQSGRGRFVGTCFLMEGHAGEDFGAFAGPLNFLEGDEVGVIDDQPYKGTGTEDYLNGSFYFKEGPFGTAFAQGWGVSSDDSTTPASGHVSACRWHVLGDAIHFSENIDLDLEVGPNRPDLLGRYRTVAYFYQ